MKKYIDMLLHIIKNGKRRKDRTGTGTISVFGYQERYDLQEGFPLLTTKKIAYRLILHELLWFISGEENIRYLQDNNVHIWDEWADEDGNLGPVYGKQWRDFGGVDQLLEVQHSLRTNPYSRRHIITAWNPPEVADMKLPPCHCFFQFYVREDKYLDCHLYQRSTDAFLGGPFDLASYATLVHMMAQCVDLKPGVFIYSHGDLHVYLNHLDQVQEQVQRDPKPLPRLELNPEIRNIQDFEFENVKLLEYDPHPAIKGKVSV